jgi:hypothetical protein
MRATPEELYPLFLDSISEGVFTVDNGFIVLVGVGFIPLPEVPGYMEYQATHEPRSWTRGVHDAHFREFVNTYKRDRRIFRRLNASRRSGARAWRPSRGPAAVLSGANPPRLPPSWPSPGQPD